MSQVVDETERARGEVDEREKKRKRNEKESRESATADLLTPVLRLSLFSNEYAMTH